MDNPKLPGKLAAFSQAKPGKALGRTMRTSNYRYTQWTQGDQIVAEELYDHQSHHGENVNLSQDSQYQHILEKLCQQFDACW